MNSLLIVDDEVFTVDIIKSQFDWEELGIGAVYTAYSMNQAIKVLEEHQVDVMICDIEMGTHSGLELLEWVRDHHLDVVSFFLTGHAQFDYCRRAIELGSIDYVLKPIEFDKLRGIILTAVAKAEEQKKKARDQEQSENWIQSSKNLLSQFWSDVISDTIAPDREIILHKAALRGIPMKEDGRYLLLLSHWSQEEGAATKWGKTDLRYALNNMAADLFDGLVTGTSAITTSNNFYILQQMEEDPQAQQDKLAQDCRRMMGYAREHLEAELTFCMGSFLPPEKMSEQFREVYSFFQSQGKPGAGVLLLGRDGENKTPYQKPDTQTWVMLLEKGRGKDLLAAVERYLDQCLEQGTLNGATLRQFQQDFYHIIYLVADQYLVDRTEIGAGAQWSLTDLEGVKATAGELVHWLIRRLGNDSGSNTAVDRAKAYIDANLLGADISRDKVADYVGLNPEYLSRTFKKQEGISLLEYIQAKKVEIACRLLKDTGLSVSDVAAKLGYANFAYFAQVFKKTTGLTPMAYRKTNQ
ncbi:MAG: response regulator [Oscillospiraceae bacterium]|nr:response regulator [Oscillospiraceae bacterium]